MSARDRIAAVKNSPIIRVRDVIVMIAFTLIVAAIALVIALGGRKGETVFVTKDGETAAYPLGENRTIDFGSLKVVIEDGSVFVTGSTCPDKLCEKTGRISESGRSIVCLPAGIVVRIGDSEFDAVTGGAA